MRLRTITLGLSSLAIAASGLIAPSAAAAAEAVNPGCVTTYGSSLAQTPSPAPGTSIQLPIKGDPLVVEVDPQPTGQAVGHVLGATTAFVTCLV